MLAKNRNQNPGDIHISYNNSFRYLYPKDPQTDVYISYNNSLKYLYQKNPQTDVYKIRENKCGWRRVGPRGVQPRGARPHRRHQPREHRLRLKGRTILLGQKEILIFKHNIIYYAKKYGRGEGDRLLGKKKRENFILMGRGGGRKKDWRLMDTHPLKYIYMYVKFSCS